METKFRVPAWCEGMSPGLKINLDHLQKGRKDVKGGEEWEGEGEREKERKKISLSWS